LVHNVDKLITTCREKCTDGNEYVKYFSEVFNCMLDMGVMCTNCNTSSSDTPYRLLTQIIKFHSKHTYARQGTPQHIIQNKNFHRKLDSIFKYVSNAPEADIDSELVDKYQTLAKQCIQLGITNLCIPPLESDGSSTPVSESHNTVSIFTF